MDDCERTSDETENNTLKNIFEEGWDIYTSLQKSSDSTNSEKFQDETKKAIKLFEKATKMISLLGVFSTNEAVEELGTSDLRYLLLPALLGDLTQKLLVERLEALNTAEIYYKDFLKRCSEYEITDIEIPVSSGEASKDSQPSLEEMTRNREAKIKRYKQQRDFEKKIENLSEVVNKPGTDEEVIRDYYLTLIKKWCLSSVEELSNIEMEKPFLSHRAKLKAEEKESGKQEKSVEAPRQPLKPIIITKNEMQKQIFGLGYPGLPSMTIEEFYEAKLKTAPSKQQPDTNSLMARAMGGYHQQEQKEKDEIEKESKIENDDLETLRYQREFDDWKDDNRRGCGNRKNMG